MKCTRNLVLISYVKSSKPLPAFVRKVSELNGKIVEVNEELRRVLFRVSQTSLESLKGLLSEFTSSHSAVFKIVCEDVDIFCLRERLIRDLKAKAWAKAYYLEVENSVLVSVELKGNRAILKLGRGSLIVPISPSLFYLSLEEVESMLTRAENVIKSVIDNCIL
ncbi:MAG: hypothetical protein QXE20_00820 [Acidilobaceae archaeon]